MSARAASPERHPGHVELTCLDEFDAALRSGDFGPLPLGGPDHLLDTTDCATLDYPALIAAIRASVTDG